MRRAGLVLAQAAVALVTAACGPTLSLADPPQLLFFTDPFEVGAEYTYGAVTLQGPATITQIELVEASGVEVIATGAFDPDAAGQGIGLVPGWPPDEGSPEILDAIDDGIEFTGVVQVVIGIRTTEPISGLRGILVKWEDADGNGLSEVFDYAVATCAPGACDEAEGELDEWVLTELGLLVRP